MRKKLLTLNDLVRFCQEQNFMHFSSMESGYKLAVQLPTVFEVDENVDDDHRGMLKLKFRIFHTGLNRNGSYVSKESADKAIPTIKDRPILAHIHQLDDGSWDFEAHDVEVIENEDGEEEIVYIEKQVGSFTSDEPFWEHDDELDKDFLCAYGYIAEEYTKAAEIIRRKGWTKNSCELVIEEMSYNAKEKYLELITFYLSGSTLLGAKADGTPIGEGMLGSRADIAGIEAFSEKENSLSLVDIIKQSVKEAFDDIENSKKGGQTVENENLKPMEGFAEEEETLVGDNAVEEATVETPSEEENTEVTITESETEQEAGETGEENPVDKNEIHLSIQTGETTKEFSLSLMDKQYAITELVNAAYGETDNTYYCCNVYDEYVVMIDWFTDKAYKQSYKEENEAFTLTGDRVEVFAEYLTQEELDKINEMRNNYSRFEEVEAKLAQYEAEPEKIALLNSADYEQIKETEGYKELAKRENYFSLEKDALVEKLDAMLLEYAKGHKVEFTTTEEPKINIGVKTIAPTVQTEVKGRYGGTFNRK